MLTIWAPKLFNILADLLTWIAKDQGDSNCLHYLGDFLLMGSPESISCQDNLAILVRTCEELGVPLAMEKPEGPSTALTFLGIETDTSRMDIRLQRRNLIAYVKTLTIGWGGKKLQRNGFFLSWLPSTCHRSRTLWPVLCCPYVCYSSQSKAARLFHKIRSRVPVRPSLVPYLLRNMEWFQPAVGALVFLWLESFTLVVQV